ncbi:hypothetical protein FRC10_000814 [Ceratobasidium sp. 414]|nr:hypothetical protein FRC10_000814 [Ceratobasidium sp. 414]
MLSDDDEPGDKIPPPTNKGNVKISDIQEMMGLNGRKGDKRWLELQASIRDLLIQSKIDVATPWKGQDKTRLALIYHTAHRNNTELAQFANNWATKFLVHKIFTQRRNHWLATCDSSPSGSNSSSDDNPADRKKKRKERQKWKKEEWKEREREGRERRKEEKEWAKEKASASKAKERQEREQKQEEQEEREHEREEREREKREEEEREREKREEREAMAREAAKTKAEAKACEVAKTKAEAKAHKVATAKAAGSKRQSDATTKHDAARALASSAPVPSQGKPRPHPCPPPPPSDMLPDNAEASTLPDKASGSRHDNKPLSHKSSGAGPATPACPPAPTTPNQTLSAQTCQKLAAAAAAVTTAKCAAEDKATTQTTKPPEKKHKGRMSWTMKKGGHKAKGKGKAAARGDDTGSSDLSDPKNDNGKEGFGK